jgi:hypothetical protein
LLLDPTENCGGSARSGPQWLKSSARHRREPAPSGFPRRRSGQALRLRAIKRCVTPTSMRRRSAPYEQNGTSGRVEWTSGPSTSLRSGRDDKFIAPESLNCRSLGYARDDKGEGSASIWFDGSNESRTDLVHIFPNLPQESQSAPDQQKGARPNWMLVERTAGPSTTLRSGRDDNSFVTLTFTITNLGVFIPHSTCRRQVEVLRMRI